MLPSVPPGPFTVRNLVKSIEDALITQGFDVDILFQSGPSASLVVVTPADHTKVAHCLIALSSLPPVPEESE